MFGSVDPHADLPRDHALLRRVDAAQATLDEWRPRPWRMGEADCVRMVASHLRRMGYQVRLPPARSYRTVKSAEAMLDKHGLASVADALDGLGLARIAPASALVGDIMQMASDSDDDRLPALVVVLGNGRVVGWHPDVSTGAVVMQPLSHMVTAWRVEPKEAVS